MRIAVVGAGRWGTIHCQKVHQNLSVNLVGVVDNDPRRASALGLRFGIPSFASVDECIEADAFIIATPIEKLEQIADSVMALGKPFLVEKPMGTSATILRAFMEKWQHSLQLGRVGYQLRFHPRLSDLRSQKHYRFVRHEAHFKNVNGLLDDCGVHEIDLARHLLSDPLRLQVLNREEHCLEALATTAVGATVSFTWRSGVSCVRQLHSPLGSIDFTKTEHDLLMIQLSEFAVRKADSQTRIATIPDACEVLDLLRELKE